jgi:rod shape-determining protein MreD
LILQYLFVLVAGLVAVLIQTTLASYIFHNFLLPDFLFVMVVLLGFFKNSLHGAAMAFLLGALEDRFTGQILGLYMCARISVYFVATRLSQRFSPNNPLGQLIFALGLGVFDKLLILGLLFLFSPGPELGIVSFSMLGLEVIINALFTPLFYPLFSWFPGLLEPGLESKQG